VSPGGLIPCCIIGDALMDIGGRFLSMIYYCLRVGHVVMILGSMMLILL